MSRSSFSRWSAGSAAFMALGIASSAAASLVISTPALAANFSDVGSGYWANPFIQRLSDENIIAGFPDGTFKPNQPVTRAQFAAIVKQAFNKSPVRQYTGFNDISSGYWAISAIQEAYTTGFMTGYPGGLFRPEEQIPKVQVLVSLSSGLRLDATGSTNNILERYRDSSQIPNYAKTGVAAATQKGIVVNYPNINFLNPNQTATRADVAAFVYQALVNQGRLQPLPNRSEASRYIVNPGVQAGGNNNSGNQNAQFQVSSGTLIDLKYPGSNNAKLIVATNETVPATFQVATAVKNSAGDTLIPVNSQIQGRFVPVRVNNNNPGTQFIADKLVINGKSYNIQATSNPRVAVGRQAITSGTIQGAVTTATARTILSSILGNQVNLGTVLAGALGGGTANTAPTTQDSVIIINPQDLDLTVQSNFSVASTDNATPIR